MSVSFEIPHQCGFLVYANITTYAIFFLMLFYYVRCLRNSRVVQAVALLPMCFGYVQATCPTENTFFGIGIILDLVLITLILLLKYKRVGITMCFATLMGRASATDGVHYNDDVEIQVKAAVTMLLAVLTVSSITNYYNKKFFDYMERYNILQNVPMEQRMSAFILLDKDMTPELRRLMYVPWTLKSILLKSIWNMTGLHFAVPKGTIVYGCAARQLIINTVMPQDQERVLFYLAYNGSLIVDGVVLTMEECPFEGIHPFEVICAHQTANYANTLQYGMTDLESEETEKLMEAGDTKPHLMCNHALAIDDIRVKGRTEYAPEFVEAKAAKMTKFSSLEDLSTLAGKAVSYVREKGGFKDAATGWWVCGVAANVKEKMRRAVKRSIGRKKRREMMEGKDPGYATEASEAGGFVPPHFVGTKLGAATDEERKYAIVKYWVTNNADAELFALAGDVYYIPKEHQVCLTPYNMDKYKVVGNELPELDLIKRNTNPPEFFVERKDNVPAINAMQGSNGKFYVEQSEVQQGAYIVKKYDFSLDEG